MRTKNKVVEFSFDAIIIALVVWVCALIGEVLVVPSLINTSRQLLSVDWPLLKQATQWVVAVGIFILWPLALAIWMVTRKRKEAPPNEEKEMQDILH